jgi:hypothetical protein
LVKRPFTFAEDIVFTAVNNNAENFHKVALDSYPTIVIWAEFVFTFVDLGELR